MPQSYMLKIYIFCVSILFPIMGLSEVMDQQPLLQVTAAQPATKTTGIRPMTDTEFTSAMCILGATAGMAITYMAGPNEIIMLVVGGVVVPSSPTILFWSLFGTMAAAGCTIGSTSTAAISWLYQ